MTFENMPSFERARLVDSNVINQASRSLRTLPSTSLSDVGLPEYRFRIRPFGADFLVLDVSTWQANRHQRATR